MGATMCKPERKKAPIHHIIFVGDCGAGVSTMANCIRNHTQGNSFPTSSSALQCTKFANWQPTNYGGEIVWDLPSVMSRDNVFQSTLPIIQKHDTSQIFFVVIPRGGRLRASDVTIINELKLQKYDLIVNDANTDDQIWQDSFERMLRGKLGRYQPNRILFVPFDLSRLTTKVNDFVYFENKSLNQSFLE